MSKFKTPAFNLKSFAFAAATALIAVSVTGLQTTSAEAGNSSRFKRSGTFATEGGLGTTRFTSGRRKTTRSRSFRRKRR